MEQEECSGRSAQKIQTPGNHPKERIIQEATLRLSTGVELLLRSSWISSFNLFNQLLMYCDVNTINTQFLSYTRWRYKSEGRGFDLRWCH
jgi:hypothetical protein